MISSLTISVQLLDQFPIYSLFIRTTVDHYVRDKGGGAVLEETKVVCQDQESPINTCLY